MVTVIITIIYRSVTMMVEIVVSMLETATVMITVIHLCVTMMVEIAVDHV